MPSAPFIDPPLIKLCRVTVMRGENIALRDLSLTIGAGEHVAILGPNGCGKSTLIKTITRECYPLARPGRSVEILGQSLWNMFDLRSMLGIVSNDLMTQCTREITGFDVVLSGFFSSIGIWPNHHVTDEMRDKAHRGAGTARSAASGAESRWTKCRPAKPAAC